MSLLAFMNLSDRGTYYRAHATRGRDKNHLLPERQLNVRWRVSRIGQ
jgi:hypothetical protein